MEYYIPYRSSGGVKKNLYMSEEMERRSSVEGGKTQMNSIEWLINGGMGNACIIELDSVPTVSNHRKPHFHPDQGVVRILKGEMYTALCLTCLPLGEPTGVRVTEICNIESELATLWIPILQKDWASRPLAACFTLVVTACKTVAPVPRRRPQ
jgi:hypothetical protein